MKRRPPALRTFPEGPAPTAILNRRQLAKWLQISERSLDKLHVPSLPLTGGVRSYLVSDVLAWLHRERAA